MHLYLQQTGPGLPAPRYVRLTLGQDLFGAWELIRESGLPGGKTQLRRDLFMDRNLALEAFEKARASHIKRGFSPLPDTDAES